MTRHDRSPGVQRCRAVYRIFIPLILCLFLFPYCGKNPSGAFTDQPVAFTVKGEEAVMRGVIDETTINRMQDLVDQHPEVTTLVMEEVPGSNSARSTFSAARIARLHGLKTHIPPGGVVASGGTDFFIAGLTRTIGVGGKVGVHSWETKDNAGNPIIGASLPRTHGLHRNFISYYIDMGIPEDFYWFSIAAAPPDGVHWMTEEELERYGLLRDAAP